MKSSFSLLIFVLFLTGISSYGIGETIPVKDTPWYLLSSFFFNNFNLKFTQFVQPSVLNQRHFGEKT